MANVDGIWDCVALTPLGEQKVKLTVRSDGSTFTGSTAGSLGSVEIADGTVDGDTLRWAMEISMPMSLRLDCNVTVNGDTLEGGITAGGFGTFPISGARA